MRIRTARPLIVLVAFLVLVVHLTPARAGILGFGDLSKANKAFEAGQLAEALPIYQQILAETKTWDEKRGEAVWHIALIRLGGTAQLKDTKAGCSLLGELRQAYSQQPHEVAIRGMLDLCHQADSAHGQIAGLQQKAESAQARTRDAQRDTEKARGERDAARRRVSELEAQLKQAKAELSRKDALLQHLTGTLITSPGNQPRR